MVAKRPDTNETDIGGIENKLAAAAACQGAGGEQGATWSRARGAGMEVAEYRRSGRHSSASGMSSS